MSETVSINFQAFEPWNGGEGVSLTATGTTGSAPIPGLEGGIQDYRSRVLITGDDAVPVWIRMGQSGVRATLSSLKIMPGVGYLLKPPNVGTSPVYIAAITDAGVPATINACSGQGT